jgi:hypothetical protein
MEQSDDLNLVASDPIGENKWQRLQDELATCRDAARSAKLRVVFEEFDGRQNPFQHKVRGCLGFLA